MPTYKGEFELLLTKNSYLSSLLIYYFHFAVKVKWGKETFNNVEVSTDEEPILFKAQLFALTGVQPERQKVMIKGSTLKDNEWGNVKLTDVSYVSSENSFLSITPYSYKYSLGNNGAYDGYQRRRNCQRT